MKILTEVADREGIATELCARLIPCLDLDRGRVVKGVRFADLRDEGDPAELAQAYEADGADELVLLDVSATREDRGFALDAVRRVRAVCGLPITCGGGVASVRDAERLLEAGADKVAVNTAAVRDPALIERLSSRFGSQCIVLSIDAARRRGPDGEERLAVLVGSGSEDAGLDAVAWAQEGTRRGAGEILLTSWDRDGTKEGYDLEALASVASAVATPVIASGGAGSVEDLIEALRAGASAVLAASLFHRDGCRADELKDRLARAGVEVRR